jgi:hypothetical protein
MSDRLTAKPGTMEFLRQLRDIAAGSDHAMDKAILRALDKQIKEAEGESTATEASEDGA